MSLIIRNAWICNPDGEAHGDVLVKDGIIQKVGSAIEESSCIEEIDADGRLLFPGFIDLHVQGAGGRDMLDADPDTLKTISKVCAQYGVTGFLGTTVYHPEKKNEHLDVSVSESRSELPGARFLGFHLEGPFISPKRRGMIHDDAISAPSLSMLYKIFMRTGGMLRMMTIAPELNGALEIVGELCRRGIVASFGHSAATYEETLRGFEAGISHVTHLFNAMNPLHHRSPGPLLAIFETSCVSAQIISDGVHLVPRVVRFAASLLGDDRTILITDGMQAMGLGDGRYVYDGREYESKDGTARYYDGTLIGTALGMSQMAARFREFTDWPLSSIAKVTSLNPAKILGLAERKGSIRVGKDADLVILNRDFSVLKTIVAGKVVY
ncbi:MAG: N-acetylglucosamine-6-phosphate deacetylase [Thermoproteota archaeon]